MNDIRLVAADEQLPSDVDSIRIAALREGFRFVDRLVAEWQVATRRFDRSGEAFFWARHESTLIGCGGLGIDGYLNDPLVGRVQHVYVLPKLRRSGIGRQIVETVVARARRHFGRLRLRTQHAAMFYESLGFMPVDEPEATHSMKLNASA